MANIKVSDSTRDELMEIAKNHPGGKVSLDKIIQQLLAEHRKIQAERLSRLLADEEFMAHIEAARREPLENGYSTEEVLAMLAERQRAESA